ncbi:MAG: TIM barrel protein [Candidatus Micrarchaeota archaeon]|nr:TIM barrel protein [Candidatus Micrarchaeota archaeon]
MLKFGPAGIPIGCKNSLEAPEFLDNLGLESMELEFVRGVTMGEQTSEELGKRSKKYNITLSCHAPYWINLAAKEPHKIHASINFIVNSAKILSIAGGGVVVFHPAYYLSRPSEEVYGIVKKNMETIISMLEKGKIRNIILGPELTGKKSAFGDLNEIIMMAKDFKELVPVVDFAHYHARHEGKIKGEKEYLEIFNAIENELGKKYVQNFHCHFSEIRYSKAGELSHLPLFTTNEPPIKPLLKVCVENGYSGNIICETPFTSDDSLRMKEIYLKLKN